MRATNNKGAIPVAVRRLLQELQRTNPDGDHTPIAWTLQPSVHPEGLGEPFGPEAPEPAEVLFVQIWTENREKVQGIVGRWDGAPASAWTARIVFSRATT